MLVLLGTILAIGLVPVLGGSLRALTELRLHGRWLLPAALALQVLALSVLPTWPRPLLVCLHGASYVLAGAFVWVNRGLPGLPLLAAGGAANALVIALNSGTLPASRGAVVRSGMHVEAGAYVNAGVLPHPRLAWLGDVFASPAWLPLHNVYSLGDLLILTGAVWLVNRTCGTVLGRALRAALRRPLGVRAR